MSVLRQSDDRTRYLVMNARPALSGNMMSPMADSAHKRTPMSDEHKAALAEGREQGRAVRRYLEALEAHRPRRGRKRTPESMAEQLQQVEERLANADPLKRLQLYQQKLDLETALAANDAKVDLETLEKEFIGAAGPYSARKGISYLAWREMGVPTQVLAKAGITRGT
jgi:hypothetical protein